MSAADHEREPCPGCDVCALILRNVIMPTAAMLCAEEAAERWCCPLCGGLNNAEALPGRMASAAGFCQHDRCVRRREAVRSILPWAPRPEIEFIGGRLMRERAVLA